MSLLAPADVSRLAKICSLFSSNHTGERAAAAFKADQIVRSAGFSWLEVISVTSVSQSPRQDPAAQMAAADILARHEIVLTGWEKGFLGSIARRRRDLTARQKQVFAEIRDRVLRASR